ncbi:hypothetical protein Daus18300_006571 [Diaporthe australafricana]|uniref:Alpha-L-rhamnosidase six-hairpin glycosidase domain-containing protein n=1 Tax=Diaporthe australafricana TaxID=127596 RepID=A0ABR3WT67_9PEZI
MKSLNSLKLLASLAAVVGSADHAAALTRRAADFLPVGLALGETPSLETTDFTSFTLREGTPLATLDYGTERAGYAFFAVSSLSQPVQIEVRYSEPFAGLSGPWTDGPFLFSPGLSNGFRAETFNVTEPGRFAAPLVQGGQRWQSIALLTGGSVTFESVGFEATVDLTAVADLPGAFDSSDNELNAVWGLGAVAASTACVDKGSQGAVWEVDSVNGILVRSTKPSITLEGTDFSIYTLDFDTNIVRGGIWWTVAAEPRYRGIQLMLVSDLPESTTFVNTNKTFLQPNTILLGYGFNFLNQSLVNSYLLDYFPVPFTVSEGTWYHLSTALSQTGHLSVSVDHQIIFNVSLADYYVNGIISTTGSFGFGGWQDQTSHVRNVTATDTTTGALLYANPMLSQDVLAEYGTQANVAPACLDGPKRDRLVWLGDFYHTARIIATSTSRGDLSSGTLEFLLDTQAPDGELSISPPMGYDAANTFATPGDLVDYQFLGLASLHSYVQHTNDLAFAARTWAGWQKAVSFLLSTISAEDGLVHVPVAFLGPPDAGSAVSCLAAQALRGLADIAGALNDTASQGVWAAAADSLRDAINARLWNDALGVYGLSTADMSDFSVASASFCITAGVADGTRAARSLAAVEARLKLYPGYRDATTADATSAQISPNTNGFLLDALFAAAAAATSSAGDNATAGNLTAMGGALIRSLWGAMLADNATSTGGSWEYVSQQGQPGLGLFTSLAHPWGGAATYVLTERVLGLRPAQGVEGFGYGSWVVDVAAGVRLGVARVSGRVVTASGGVLDVGWAVEGGERGGVLRCVVVAAPAGTVGVLVYLGRTVRLEGATSYNVTIDL